MPKNELFSFSVIVGDRQVAEHVKDGNTYIEADILGPYSRQEERCELVDGEEERQTFSVLPYQIDIQHLDSSSTTPVWAFVYVDGFNVSKKLMHPGRAKNIVGFKDGENFREFLFSMPRFGNKDDIIEERRQSSVGVIEVVMKEAIFVMTRERNTNHKRKLKNLEYTQATKNDSKTITDGKYLMATTKPGNCIAQRKAVSGRRKRDLFHVGEVLGSLKVNYHLKSALNQMGIMSSNTELDTKCDIVVS